MHVKYIIFPRVHRICYKLRLFRSFMISDNFSKTSIRRTSKTSSMEHCEKGDSVNYPEKDRSGDDTMDFAEVVIDKIPSAFVTEGKATVAFPSSQDVFYNPVQEFNRDLSVAVMRQFVKTVSTTAGGLYKKLREKYGKKIEINVLEALSASGLRSIRYAKEVEGLNSIVANDMSPQAHDSILFNIKKNEVEHIVTPKNVEATLLMYQNKKKFDIVDIDPYGAASIFLDAAVQAVIDGGLLMVTCTDMAVLCGNSPETCHAKYGAIPAKVPYCHEMALRIVLQSIEANANKYGRYIEPVLSISVDFYVRIFVRVFTGPAIVKRSVSKLSMVYICPGCNSYHLQPLGVQCSTEKGSKYMIQGLPVNKMCEICDSKFRVFGPMWSASIHDKEFIFDMLRDIEESESQLNTAKRILGMLTVILEELDDAPLFHKMDKLCGTVHVVVPTIVQFRSALLHAGYKVSMSHTMPSSIKTNAPQHVVWDIVRAWAKLHPGKKTFDSPTSKSIMSKKSSIEVSFEPRDDANPESRASGLVRFQMNPQPYWGPGCRAKTSLYCDQPVKAQKNQYKKLKSINPSEDLGSMVQCKKLKSTDQQEHCNKVNDCT